IGMGSKVEIAITYQGSLAQLRLIGHHIQEDIRRPERRAEELGDGLHLAFGLWQWRIAEGRLTVIAARCPPALDGAPPIPVGAERLRRKNRERQALLIGGVSRVLWIGGGITHAQESLGGAPGGRGPEGG